MPGSRIEYIMAAIEYIEEHLTEKLDLDRIAGAVHCSKYHLHRMFTDLTGLTLHDYVQRRRLTEAAKLLVFSGKPVLDIALLAGYESQQAFTNIFTTMYKTSPGKYRENEKFYPLQLKFQLEGGCKVPDHCGKTEWNITLATEDDIPCWMELVRLIVDGYPHLYEDEYLAVLKQRIIDREALILKAALADGDIAIGIMMFSYETGSIDMMGSHPLYRKQGIPAAFLEKVMEELLQGKDLSITTYREGDRADTGHRRAIKGLGFAEAELLVEYGYPTQRFVLSKEADHEPRTKS